MGRLQAGVSVGSHQKAGCGESATRDDAASLVVDVVNASWFIGELVCTLDRVKFVRDASLTRGEASLEGRRPI